MAQSVAMMRRLIWLAGLIGFTVLLSIPTPSYGQKHHPDLILETQPKVDSSAPRVARLGNTKLYAQWWVEIAKCEGLPIRPAIDRIRYYAVNATSFQAVVEGDTLDVIGVAYPDDDELYVAAPLIADERLLKHEFLHFLAAWSGYRFKNFHPIEFFEKCGIHRTGS